MAQKVASEPSSGKVPQTHGFSSLFVYELLINEAVDGASLDHVGFVMFPGFSIA